MQADLSQRTLLSGLELDVLAHDPANEGVYCRLHVGEPEDVASHSREPDEPAGLGCAAGSGLGPHLQEWTPKTWPATVA